MLLYIPDGWLDASSINCILLTRKSGRVSKFVNIECLVNGADAGLRLASNGISPSKSHKGPSFDVEC